MGLFDRWLRPDKQQTKKSFKPLEAAWSNIFLKNTSEINSSDGKDQTYINQGYRINPTVYSIINTVSKNAGMVKWGVYKKHADGTKKPYTDVRLQELLNNPNGLGTWNHLIQQAIGFKMLTGNLYFWLVEGAAESLYVLPSHRVQIQASDSKRGIIGYNLDFYGNTQDALIPADQVLHIKDFNPRFNQSGDFLYGQSPLSAALTTLYTNNDAIQTSRSYLLNQGPRGILSMKMDDEYGEMSEEQINALRGRFKRNNTGTKKAGELLVAPGDWKWNEIGSTAADLKLIEHYNLTKVDICNVYGFPAPLLGNGETTFNNLKEQKKVLWSDVITPILSEIRDGLNTWLASRYGRGVCLDFDLSTIPELQEDRKSQSDAIAKLQGVITINEARSFLNLAPLAEGGDELYIFRQGVENGTNKGSREQEGREENDGETQ